jgi:diaminopimelate decarboxylase
MQLTEGLEYRDGRLLFEEAALEDAADKFGTPLYLYSPELMLERYARLKADFRKLNALLCYAMKANSNLALLKELAWAGAGVEVVSGGELALALKARFKPSKILFSGVGKTRAEMRQALDARIQTFNVESHGEMDALEEEAARMGVKAPVSIRVNPDIDAGTHRNITTGKAENKFGLSIPDALAAYRRAARSWRLEPIGLHAHLGSQILSPEPYRRSAKVLAKMIAELEEDGHLVGQVDIGGGFGVPYGEGERLDTSEVAKAAASLSTPGRRVVVEPGRYLVAEAGILLTRVQYVKRTSDRTFVILDAGMNDLLRPALYGSVHPIVPDRLRPGRPEPLEFVGPICETSDTFGVFECAEPAPGDLFAILMAGAYGYSMSSQYNSRPRPAEALVEEGKLSLARKRETMADLV